MGPHPYHIRSKAWQAYSPATEPTDSQMGTHCASPPTFKPASSNKDAQMLSHSFAPPISNPDYFVEGFHMHSRSASPATFKPDSLGGVFHMHSRVATPGTSDPNAINEIFHVRSYSAALPTYNPASPDEEIQKGFRSNSRPKFDTASLCDNHYELTHNYFGPTKWSDFLESHSSVSCPYPCGHWPYMAATHDRYLPYSGANLHLLELRETANEHTNVDQASMTSDDQTTVEVWGPSPRGNPMCNAKEVPIPWAEWTHLPPWPENSSHQTPLEALPPILPYRRSGVLHLNNDPIQKHSASISRQRPKPRFRLDAQNVTSRANQRLVSKPRALDLNEALSLVCSTKAQRQAPESTFAWYASFENPYMGYEFPYLDDGFIEFAKSSLGGTFELPDQYGAASSRPGPASSFDVFTRSAQPELINSYAMWQVSSPESRAFSPP